MSKYRLILIDTLILCMVSTVLAVVFNFTVDKLKGEVKKDDPIVIAIIQADAKEVEKLVQMGAGVTNETDELGRTALMRAAFANYFETRPAPRDAPATILRQTDDKRVAMVGMLVEHGARLDTRDRDGWSALMWASWSGLTEVAAKLLDLGASPEFADRQGHTALIIAARRGNAEIVEALLAKGADPAVRNRAGESALDAARAGMAQYPDNASGFTAIIARLARH